MAGSRKPGPLGLNPQTQDLNDGTMIRGLSPRPGPIGAKSGSIVSIHGNPSVFLRTARTLRKQSATVNLPVLRQGSRGQEVQKLQRQLNTRLRPSPQLVVDGIFGPHTHQAVLQYQRSVSIAADGIVGKQTWYYLLKGNKAVQPSNIAFPPTAAVGVWDWPLEDKFAEALRRTAPKLPGSMRREFEALLSPTSLGIMAGTLVAWAGSHAFGVGEVVDVVLLIGGAFFLGMAVFDVVEELGDFLVMTSTATDVKDLDEAASHLARAIAIMGVATFIALLAKVARGRGGKSAAAETPPKVPKTEPAPKAARPQPPAEPPPRPRTTAPRSSAPATPLKPPAQRHYAHNVKQNTFVREKNSVVERGVDVDADVRAINSGQATRIGDQYVVNGRTYGQHDGTLYPMSGPGVHQLDRGAYKALGVYNKFGDTPAATRILDNMKISETQRAAARTAWEASKGGI